MSQPPAKDPRNPWTTVSERTVYANPWISLFERQVLMPNGKPGIYGVVRFGKVAVGALPIEADGTVRLVGQWRVPLDAYSWEMPEGGAEPGEPPEACARRELEEEAGVTADGLIEILQMDLSNSVSDERAVCYLAYDLRPGRLDPDETEVLAQRRAHFLDVLEEVVTGRIRDAITVATVLRAHHMAMTGALPEALAKAMLTRPAGATSASD